ncbi:MAG TPA: NmrA family NAD(P)-binding protein [Rhizomicrobium sp.]|jgi:uncharacterized protein YbjT (DUF2867 family)
MSFVTVFGASGRQGLAQVRQLTKAGHRVRAISRRSDPFLGERFDNTEVMAADLDDADSLARAVAGADVVFFTRPLIQARDPIARITALGCAAQKAGVKRLVFNTSLYVPEKPIGQFTYDIAVKMENTFAETGVPLTVFRPVLFMDNLLTNWARPFIVHEGRYVYPHRPDLGANWISLDDVAKFMIAAMDRADLEGARIVIGGPERLTPPQVAQILSDAVSRPVRYDPCTPEAFSTELVKAFGDEFPAAMRAPTEVRIAEFYHFNNDSPIRPFEVDMAPVLKRIPVKMEALRDWAARQDWSDSAKRPPAG